MSRSLALAVFAVGLLVGLGSIYFLLLGPQPNPVPPPPISTVPPLSAAEILATAKSRVTAPMPPPLPPNADVKIAQKPLLLHLPSAQLAQITRPVPQISVNTPADAAWQNQVNAQQAAYEQALQAEIDAILKQQQAAEAANAAAAQAASSARTSDWITSVLIPLIGAVGGLLTAVAALVTAFRRQTDRPAAP